jgi:anti-anti-sigma factor
VSVLCASVAAGESGPVLVLSGEADLTSAAQLSELISDQLAGGTTHLTIDASELSFMDSMTIRALMLVARALRGLGGGLVLLRPQKPVAEMLTLLGADQVITTRTETRITAEPDDLGHESGTS